MMELRKKVRNLRILVGVLLVAFVLDFIGSYGIYEEKEQLKQELKSWKIGCESACKAHDALNDSIAEGLCLPKLVEV